MKRPHLAILASAVLLGGIAWAVRGPGASPSAPVRVARAPTEPMPLSRRAEPSPASDLSQYRELSAAASAESDPDRRRALEEEAGRFALQKEIEALEFKLRRAEKQGDGPGARAIGRLLDTKRGLGRPAGSP